MKMSDGIIFIPVLVLGTLLIWLWPGKEERIREVPVIITQYDTVETLPSWYKDSLKVWKKTVHTTDTVNIVITNTIVDTTYVYVGPDTILRPNIWPLLSFRSGGRFGDTAVISTFSLRNGDLGVSKVFSPGILTAIEVDSGSVPRLSFAPFPPEEKHNFWHNPKVFGLGTAFGMSITALACVVN